MEFKVHKQHVVTNGTYVDPALITTIIDYDADVYDADTGKLLLKFRKNALHMNNVKQAYEALIHFAKNTTKARGACSGSDEKHVTKNKRIASNVMGYYDQWTLLHRHMFKVMNITPPSPVRVTRFTADYSEKWERVIPLIQDIDALYKKLVPEFYEKQRAMAEQTAYKIPNTCFSTITTNLNVTTAIHKDKGNVSPSFGNLVVIEKGEYKGGYTCLPEYGIGVDVRSGDFLAMDVHRYHGNLAIEAQTPDAERLSIVCYLRKYVYERTKGSSLEDVDKTLQIQKQTVRDYYALKKQPSRA